MAKQLDSTSLILALHARYEKAWVQLNAIENLKIGQEKKIQERAPGDDICEVRGLKYRLEEAMGTTEREIDAIRTTILFQMPTTAEEALVLAIHVHNAYDLKDDPTDAEKDALQSGLDLLLDFMFGEIDYDQLACAGEQMHRLAEIAYNRRHDRLGDR